MRDVQVITARDICGDEVVTYLDRAEGCGLGAFRMVISYRGDVYTAFFNAPGCDAVEFLAQADHDYLTNKVVGQAYWKLTTNKAVGQAYWKLTTNNRRQYEINLCRAIIALKNQLKREKPND